MYRLFYYDAAPYDGMLQNPISGAVVDFSKTRSYGGRKKFFRDLNAMPQVALRIGTVNFRGWNILDDFQQELLAGTAVASSITEKNIKPNLTQKGVDMRIGIDIASLVFKKIVDRIILFSGDTDMVPAMKLARVEGVQVVVVQIGIKPLNEKLIEDSDFLRTLMPVP